MEGAVRCEACAIRRAEVSAPTRQDVGERTVDLVIGALERGLTTRGRIAASIARDTNCVTKALARLKRDGRVELSGMSNRVKTWRVVEAGRG